MIQELQDNYYVIVDNFITPIQASGLYNTFKKDIEDNPQAFIKDPQCPKSFAIYNHKLFLSLLCDKVNLMNNIMQESMLPTYAYSRLYQHGEVLTKHLDRPSCEVSVTLHLGGDTAWDIWFTKPNGEAVNYNLKPGQAAIYLGMVSEHWRDAYIGDNYGQVFLHYVRANGEHWQHYYDRVNNGCLR